jgi:PAS domain S-box-containing protein
MLPTLASRFAESDSYVEKILDIPERPDVLRLTALVERLFRVPVAYVALLDGASQVVTRIGSGNEYWPLLKTYPLTATIETPMVVRDAAEELPAGANIGDLRFAASAPLLSSSGVSLGVLIVADRDPRPTFSEEDAQALSELACALAGKLELRMIASHARESELALRETERRFRAIADSAQVLIICSAADGASTFVNKTWLDFTGRSMEEELADGGAGSVHPDSRKIVYQAYWRAFQAREPVTVEFPMRRHDGEYRWMLCRGVPRFREDGAFAGFVGTLVDFTNQYKAIAEVQKHARCASAIAKAAGLTYLLLDPQGRIEQMNSICDPAAGPDPKAAGVFIWETCIAAGHGTGAIRDAVERAASTRTVVCLQTTGTAIEGETMELSWTITPIASATGELIALVATVSNSGGTGAFAGQASAPRPWMCGGLEGPSASHR